MRFSVMKIFFASQELIDVFLLNGVGNKMNLQPDKKRLKPR